MKKCRVVCSFLFTVLGPAVLVLAVGYFCRITETRIAETYDVRYAYLKIPVYFFAVGYIVLLLMQKGSKWNLFVGILGLVQLAGILFCLIFWQFLRIEHIFGDWMDPFLFKNVYATVVLFAVYLFLVIKNIRFVLKK